MVNRNINYMYLGISLMSSFCYMNDFYIIRCSNIVGSMCVIDMYFLKKKDMIMHHIIILGLLYCMNLSIDFEYNKELTSIILSSEISTIFLSINNLLEDSLYNVKKLNQIAFITTFIYYRLYNYLYYILLNENIHNAALTYAYFTPCKIYISGMFYILLCSFFILNLYWCFIIFKTLYNRLR